MGKVGFTRRLMVGLGIGGVALALFWKGPPGGGFAGSLGSSRPSRLDYIWRMLPDENEKLNSSLQSISRTTLLIYNRNSKNLKMQDWGDFKLLFGTIVNVFSCFVCFNF